MFPLLFLNSDCQNSFCSALPVSLLLYFFFFYILMKTSCLLPHTSPSLEGTGHDLNAVFTSRTNQTLGYDWWAQHCRDDGVYLTPHIGGSSPVVSRPQASVGTRGQSIILIHLGSQSQIRGALWHYKRLWLKFIPGLFHVQGSVISNQTKDYSHHFPLGGTNVYQSWHAGWIFVSVHSYMYILNFDQNFRKRNGHYSRV